MADENAPQVDRPSQGTTVTTGFERDSDGKLPTRRTKLTEDRMERIAEARREGHQLSVCAKKGGVQRKTIHNWMNKGAEVLQKIYDPDHPADEPEDVYGWGRRYATFYSVMEDAEADFKEKLETQILDAGFGRGMFEEADWRALKWYAETVIGDEYNPKKTIEHRHEHGGKVRVSPELDTGRIPPSEREGMTKQEALDEFEETDDDYIEGDYEVLESESADADSEVDE